MSFSELTTLAIELQDGVLNITLNRPDKRNAMNSQMVQDIMSAFDQVADDRSVRAIVLRGADGHFCAGGDISGMNQQSQDGRDPSWHFNRSFGYLISKVNRAPQFVICVLEGAVLGGGFGLACASDLAIAKPDIKMAMPETSLGIVPAQISPFVVARIGLTQARRLTLLGERLDGLQAQTLGLVHHVSEEPELEVKRALDLLMKCAPNATAVTKQLVLDMAERVGLEQLLDRAADDFSAAIMSGEGQEGTQAFMQKRKPHWDKS